MTIDRLRDRYNAQPIRPFVMQMADGREVSVVHREFIMAASGGRTVIVHQPDDTVNNVDLPLVTDLELKPSTNGSRKRRRA